VTREECERTGNLLFALDHVDKAHLAPVAAGLKSVTSGGRLWAIYANAVPEAEADPLWEAATPRPHEVIHYLARKAGWDDPAPIVLPLGGNAAAAVKLAVYALGCNPQIFTRGGRLVEVAGGRLLTISAPRLRSLLSEVAWIVKGDSNARVLPPPWLLESILAEPEYSKIPEIVGVVETPVLRPDGSIVTRPGYDPATKLYYMPSCDFGEIPDAPTWEDARRAAAVLQEPVADFPFVEKVDLAAYLSLALAPYATAAIDGPTPAGVITATKAGTGKSLLVDTIAVPATGEPAARKPYTGKDAETRKTITAIAIAGERFVLFDNAERGVAFGGASLDAALTARTWQDRILGRSELTPALPLQVSWFLTGNNVVVAGDTVRRSLLVRLRSDLEQPEARTGFKHPDLVAYLRMERPRLVRAALTILRAYVVAGRPKPLEPLGSFEGWSRVVREAVAWVTGIDPIQTQGELRAEDPEAEARLALLRAWSEEVGTETAANALTLIRDGEAPTLAKALRGVDTAQALGYRLRSVRDCVTGGLVLRATPDGTKTLVWRVDKVAA
jgi:putative DNA primase/helicase